MFYSRKINIKKLVLMIFVVTMILVTGLYLFAYFSNDAEKSIISGNGRIEARETLVSSKFSGRIVALNINEGDSVKKGDLLVILDDRSLIANVDAQKAKLDEIQKNIVAIDASIKAKNSDINLYRKEVERTKTLIKQNFSSQLELDKNNNYLERAKAELKALEANKKAMQASYKSLEALIKSMEIDLEDMKIYAPTDGVILYRLVENGEIVGMGGKLFVMYNPDDLYMTIYMSSELAGQIKLGNEALIKLDAFKKEVFPAKVSFVAENAEFTPKEVETKIEREKLVFRIKLTLSDNSSRVAKPGMPGEAYVKIKDDVNLIDYVK